MPVAVSGCVRRLVLWYESSWSGGGGRRPAGRGLWVFARRELTCRHPATTPAAWHSGLSGANGTNLCRACRFSPCGSAVRNLTPQVVRARLWRRNAGNGPAAAERMRRRPPFKKRRPAIRSKRHPTMSQPGSHLKTASIIVDLRHARCGDCKVALQDALVTTCPVCGAVFDAISSNHVGLADRLRKKRQDADVERVR